MSMITPFEKNLREVDKLKSILWSRKRPTRKQRKAIKSRLAELKEENKILMKEANENQNQKKELENVQ
jgi:hypothetical protein